MGNFLKLCLILFSAPAWGAVTPSGVPNVGLGALGATTSPPSSVGLADLSSSNRRVFSLFMGANATAGNFYPLLKNGTAHQVTTGKTLYCFNFRAAGATGSSLFQLVSDTSAITYDQSTALSSGLFMGGATGRYPLRTGSGANVKSAEAGTFSVDQNRYVAVQAGASVFMEVSMDCFEE